MADIQTYRGTRGDGSDCLIVREQPDATYPDLARGRHIRVAPHYYLETGETLISNADGTFTVAGEDEIIRVK